MASEQNIKLIKDVLEDLQKEDNEAIVTVWISGVYFGPCPIFKEKPVAEIVNLAKTHFFGQYPATKETLIPSLEKEHYYYIDILFWD